MRTAPGQHRLDLGADQRGVRDRHRCGHPGLVRNSICPVPRRPKWDGRTEVSDMAAPRAVRAVVRKLDVGTCHSSLGYQAAELSRFTGALPSNAG